MSFTQAADGAPAERLRNCAAFWLLGLLNNTPYVIMIAGAKEIADEAVGLVFFCDVFPAGVIKCNI